MHAYNQTNIYAYAGKHARIPRNHENNRTHYTNCLYIYLFCFFFSFHCFYFLVCVCVYRKLVKTNWIPISFRSHVPILYILALGNCYYYYCCDYSVCLCLSLHAAVYVWYLSSCVWLRSFHVWLSPRLFVVNTKFVVAIIFFSLLVRGFFFLLLPLFRCGRCRHIFANATTQHTSTI